MAPSKMSHSASANASTFGLYKAIVTKDNSARRAAIIDQQSGRLTFDQLKAGADSIAKGINLELASSDSGNSAGHKVSFLCGNNANYVKVLLAIWKSGNVAVPLCRSHPPASWEYYVNDSESSAVVVENQEDKEKIQGVLTTSHQSKVFSVEELKAKVVEKADDAKNGVEEDEAKAETDALLLYTSGTTGSPKGVVITAKNIESQMSDMVARWHWSKRDTILHTLPLHHVHGVVNCLLTPLTVGARVVMESDFDVDRVWNHLLYTLDVNVYMAVPTIYAKLIAKYEGNMEPEVKALVKPKLTEKMRLMVSGSAALPTPILHKWKELSGHTLLERYGMTEIGMALTNPYDQAERKAGFVGSPFPSVQVRIAASGDDDAAKVLVEGDKVVADDKDDLVGELQVRGPNVFRCYYNRPEVTKKEFTEDGWFKTGDTAQFDPQVGAYKILGRTSVDIIKSGGYKISALDVERVLLEHPSIKEVAICGVEDETWGQRVAAIAVASSEAGTSLKLEQVNDWAKDKLPRYCLPTLLKNLDEIPKNAMGKVNKKELVKIAFP